MTHGAFLFVASLVGFVLVGTNWLWRWSARSRAADWGYWCATVGYMALFVYVVPWWATVVVFTGAIVATALGEWRRRARSRHA